MEFNLTQCLLSHTHCLGWAGMWDLGGTVWAVTLVAHLNAKLINRVWDFLFVSPFFMFMFLTRARDEISIYNSLSSPGMFGWVFFFFYPLLLLRWQSFSFGILFDFRRWERIKRRLGSPYSIQDPSEGGWVTWQRLLPLQGGVHPRVRAASWLFLHLGWPSCRSYRSQPAFLGNGFLPWV